MDTRKTSPIDMSQFADKTSEEILAMASEEGVELSDEDLEQVTGGASWLERHGVRCDECGEYIKIEKNHAEAICPSCGKNVCIDWS